MFLWVVWLDFFLSFFLFLDSSTLPPYNLWVLRKVMVFPVNAEGELVWGHLTFSCLLVLVCGAAGSGTTRNKELHCREIDFQLQKCQRKLTFSEIKCILQSQPYWEQEYRNRRGDCPPVLWSRSSLDRGEPSWLIKTLRKIWVPWIAQPIHWSYREAINSHIYLASQARSPVLLDKGTFSMVAQTS